jgi:cyanophycinase-like exopeptidase
VQITNKISQASVTVFRDTQKAQASQRRHERGRAIAGTISGAALQASNFIGAAAGIVSIDGGCLAILIPALLPIISFIASKVERGCAHRAEGEMHLPLSNCFPISHVR